MGWHTPLADNLDFTAGISYEYVDYDVAGIGNVGDDNGIGRGIGLRYMATDNVELNGGLQHVDMDTGGGDTGFGLGARFGITDNIDIGLSGSWADDTSAYGVNGRFYFGN